MNWKSIISAGRWMSADPTVVVVGLSTGKEAADFMEWIAKQTGHSLPWRKHDPNPGKPVLYAPAPFWRKR